MIYIRTDVNKYIATGHMMRCLSIAEKIQEKNEEVCFIVSDEVSAFFLKDKNFSMIILNVKWDCINIVYEYNLLKNRIKKTDCLLVDSYSIHSDYLEKMRKITKVAVFDDLFSEKKIADIIINYNVFYRKFDYTNRYRDDCCIMLLGEKYVPLRHQFKDIMPNLFVRKYERANVLLICGGTDNVNLIYNVLYYIKNNNTLLFNKINWKVVIGKYYINKCELEKLIVNNNNVELLCEVQDMARLMNKCDMCIAAASTVLYECCAMLLPTLFCIVADDQKYDAEVFSEKNRMVYCGNYVMNEEKTIKNIEKNLDALMNDKKRQEKMKVSMQNFIDGKGTDRIVSILMRN